MKYGTSLRVRHIVGRFEKGEELIESMRRMCARERVRAASFTAIGVLTAAELQRFDTSSREYATCFHGELALDILQLSGNISTLGQEVIVNVSAELAYSYLGQRNVVGGHLAMGRVFACEFQLCSYDDLVLERTFDAATGLPLWNRIGGAALAELAGIEPIAPEPPARRASAPAATLTSAPAASSADGDDDALLLAANAAAPRREPEIIRRRPNDTVAAPSRPAPAATAAAPAPAAPARPTPPPPQPPAPAAAAIDDDGFDADDDFDDEDDDSTPAAAAPSRPATRNAWDAAIEQTQRAEARAQMQIPDRARPPERPAAARAADDDDDDFGDDDDDVVVQKGDVLLHPTLGECVVARVEDDESAYIKVGTRKPRKFALHMFDLEPQGERNGRNVYKLVKKREQRRGA